MTGTYVEDMDFAEYLAHPAFSASGMKRILDSPARFKWEQENKTDTAAMRTGRLIHAIAFAQPHTFTVKDWDGRTTDGKSRAAEVAEQGLEVVSEDDWAMAQGIRVALSKNMTAGPIVYGKDVKHEVSAFWTDPETGVELKCRFDAIGDRAIGDLKSTNYAKPEAFAKSAATYGYFVSAPHYLAGAVEVGFGEREFYMVAAEKAAPHFISVVGINAFDLELGERLRRKAIRIYAECVERDEWPDYSGEIAYPSAPGWWRMDAEEQTGLYEIEVA